MAGLRSTVGAVVVGLAGVILAGCTDRAAELVRSSASASPPVDTAVTGRICRSATAATVDAIHYFDWQLDAMDEAAARDEQARLVGAADAIQRRFVELAGAYATWARQPVTGPVRRALTRGAQALNAITAVSYSGNQVDIGRSLATVSRQLSAACPAGDHPVS